jgi:hypothetical protein
LRRHEKTQVTIDTVPTIEKTRTKSTVDGNSLSPAGPYTGSGRPRSSNQDEKIAPEARIAESLYRHNSNRRTIVIPTPAFSSWKSTSYSTLWLPGYQEKIAVL